MSNVQFNESFRRGTNNRNRVNKDGKSKPSTIGPITLIASVYGEYQHGKLAGKVNPASSVCVTLQGDDVPHALSKLRTFSYDSRGKKQFNPLPFYRIESVVDHGKEAEKAVEALEGEVA